MTSAADHWRAQLAAWAIPEELLEAADESPYGWPIELWRRRAELARAEGDDTYTTRLVLRLAGEDGSVIDVGAGTGRSCLPLARAGLEVVAVEQDPTMAQALESSAASEDLDLEVIVGSWPEAAAEAGQADVAMAAHVVYDVGDVVRFLRGLVSSAEKAVVLELSASHPWSDLTPLYRALHGLDRPQGPRVEDLVDVVVEEFGMVPRLFRWERSGALWYADWDELLTEYGRRLVLPAWRRDELAQLLAPDVTGEEGRLYVGPRTRSLVTVWWPV